jgi:hypothetical protein
MTGPHHRRLAAALLALATLTACDTNSPPQSTPPSTSRPSSTSNTNPALPPPVKQPLDASRFMSDACQSLTEIQRQTLQLPDVTSDSPSGNFCRFTTANFAILVELTLFSGGPSSLDLIYQEHSAGRWEYWAPTEIDGYPAVAYQDNPSTAKHDCYLAVGISDSTFFNVRYGIAQAELKEKNPCTEGKSVASAVISTIKAPR